MPADFEKCVQEGGRVRTVTGPRKMPGDGPNIPDGKYCKVCWDKQNKPHWGEVHKMEDSEKRQAK